MPNNRDNDIIVVGRSGIAQVGDTLGTVLNPVGAINALLVFSGFRQTFA